MVNPINAASSGIIRIKQKSLTPLLLSEFSMNNNNNIHKRDTGAYLLRPPLSATLSQAHYCTLGNSSDKCEKPNVKLNPEQNIMLRKWKEFQNGISRDVSRGYQVDVIQPNNPGLYHLPLQSYYHWLPRNGGEYYHQKYYNYGQGYSNNAGAQFYPYYYSVPGGPPSVPDNEDERYRNSGMVVVSKPESTIHPTPHQISQQRQQKPQEPVTQSSSYLGSNSGYIGSIERKVDSYGRVLPVKRALLVGINYKQTQNVLNGCVNDVHHIKKFLIEHFEFKPNDVVILTDDQQDNVNRLPTHDNIIKGMKWLVHGSMEHDSFFFHYSGHGVLKQVKKASKGQDSGLIGSLLSSGERVPAICPMDFDRVTHRNVIDAFAINKLMVSEVHSKAHLTSIFDCCHSASMMALPYRFNTRGEQKNKSDLEIAGKSLLSSVEYYLLNDLSQAIDCLQESISMFYNGRKRLEEARETRSSKANIVMFSGCKDREKSHDTKASDGSTIYGAMTKAFVESMDDKPDQSYLELLIDIRRRLRLKKYPQTPQISASNGLFDVHGTFVM
ncbi:Ca(2+)-dependent cysteine protease [Mycoemilia scoparia]|uniref:Ca(2+)-dependent cysteine protease n=1 Tax=Mycoemilia scoparia TaxID=417184 RepID=A0A9W8DSY1_9FUNG|nr:Ca(2+)-dependent cysteine protease [Mycoemilia scoparia]